MSSDSCRFITKSGRIIGIASISSMRPLTDFINRMFSLTHLRLYVLFATLFMLPAGHAVGEDVTSLADPKNILNVMPIDLVPAFDFKIPPRPAGHVLDSAHFLTSEILQNLDDTLSQEAREHGVNIYLLTVPSLPKNALDPFTKKVAEAWTEGLFGAILVFDDETGRVAIQQSEKATKRFYEFELSRLLRDTMSSAKRPRLSREGLAHTTVGVKAALHELKMRANHEDRNSLWMRVGLALVGFLAILVGALEYFRRRPVASATSGETKSDAASLGL